MTDTGRQPWQISSPLRTWQEQALAAWRLAKGRGVVEAATGTGKTRLALAAMAGLRELHGDDLRVAVVVPTIALARQWRDEIERGLGLRRRDVGEIHSQPQYEWTTKSPVLLMVVNSARTQLRRPVECWRTEGRVVLLVVDECHRAGSQWNVKALEGPFDYTLGLSATPERSDDGHEELLYPALGRPVFRYPLLNALDDGILAPLTSVNLYVAFDAVEKSAWDDLTLDLSRAFNELRRVLPRMDSLSEGLLFAEVSRLARAEVPVALKLLGIVSARRQLLADSSGRTACVSSLSAWLSTSSVRAIVFHERIASAEVHYVELLQLGVRAVLDHSSLPAETRQASAARFKSDRCRVLVAVKSLDEGIDVPDAEVAVIVCGSKSVRQRIQRIGRVLRERAGKKALVVSVLVEDTPEEWAIGLRDDALLGEGRVRHYRWPEVTLADCLAGPASTHRPRDRHDEEFDGLE